MERPDLPWLISARKEIGVNRKNGVAQINGYWKDVVSPYNYENIFKNHPEISWCSAFTGSMLVRSGVDIRQNKSPRPVESSQYWLSQGVKLAEPEYGCVVVFDWGAGKGHVGFCTGKTSTGSLIILGGNQNSAVNEKAFLTRQVAEYIWMEGTPFVPEGYLPLRDMALEHVKT